MWLGLIALFGKILDFINPWSSYWAGKAKSRDEKLDVAQKKKDEAAKKGDFDAFLDARSDADSA